MEKKQYPESIYAILAYKEFEDTFNYDHAVDWAIDMLQYGYESEHLLMLSGIVKPTDRFECMYYLEAAIEELGLKAASGEVAVIAYVWTSLVEIVNCKDVHLNLDIIFRVANYDNILYDFSLLYWAWSELREMGAQYYINLDIKIEDMEGLTITTAKEFVEKYRAEIEALLPQ